MSINPGARLLFLIELSAIFSFMTYFLVSHSISLPSLSFQVLHKQQLAVGNTTSLPGQVDQLKLS